MKKKKLFDQTVAILVKAYQDGTLEHGNCYACAVGNLAAAALNQKIVTFNDDDLEQYESLVGIRGVKYKQTLTYNLINGKKFKKKQKNNTGYSISDLVKIEKAFEIITDCDPDGYLGLMSVVDCLMMIHNVDINDVNEAKKLFVKF